MMFIGFRLITTFPSWLSTSIRVRTMPRSGFERERVASSTETRMRSTSPGRTGCSQRNSSMPGEARLASFGRKLSARSRIIIAAGMPAAGDQAAKAAARRLLGVDMHVLRIEAAGELEDFGLVDPGLAVFENRAGHVILEIAVFAEQRSVNGASRSSRPGLNPAIRLLHYITEQKKSRMIRPRGREMNYDYIIVGGGSAGSVMANRLSAKSSNKVLLCEAGQDTPHGKVPPEILDSYPGTAYFDPRFHWTELKVHTEVISHNRPEEDRPPLRKYEQARVLGGGSSINGQLANRGAPTDYDEWEARGAAGWNWNAVLPYFKKVERDMDFDGPWHGKDGRIPVRRIFPDLWNGHAKAVAKAFKEAGFEYIQDQNGEFKDGYFPITISNLYDRRVSAAIGYLDPGTRLRDNLTISALTQVKELLFEGTRCVGVKALVDGKETEFRGGEVIVSSGAIHSPAHLLRAGIGPAGHLRDLGIEVVAHVPGSASG